MNMSVNRKKICIVGTGGCGRDVLCCYADTLPSKEVNLNDHVSFMVGDDYFVEHNIMGVDVIPQSKFDPSSYDVVVAIGDPLLRKKMVESLPPETSYATIIHPSVILSRWVHIGEGSVLAAGTILTCNINIGKHAHLNLQTTIAHDCILGDYFTAAPAVHISGNCVIGDCVYFGTNSSVKHRIKIANEVIIGMGGVVVKDIYEAGVYIGNPVSKLEKK